MEPLRLHSEGRLLNPCHQKYSGRKIVNRVPELISAVNTGQLSIGSRLFLFCLLSSQLIAFFSTEVTFTKSADCFIHNLCCTREY